MNFFGRKIPKSVKYALGPPGPATDCGTLQQRALPNDGPDDRVTIVESLTSNGSLTVPVPTKRHLSSPRLGCQPWSPTFGVSNQKGSPKAAPSFDRAVEMVSAVLNPQPDRSVYGLSA